MDWSRKHNTAGFRRRPSSFLLPQADDWLTRARPGQAGMSPCDRLPNRLGPAYRPGYALTFVLLTSSLRIVD